MTFIERVAALSEKEEPVELVVITDHSGSMSLYGMQESCLGKFNTFLAEQKAIKSPANFCHVKFNDKVEFETTTLENARPLERWAAAGNTALNDAIGIAISKLLAKRPKRAIVSILTDGMENASKLYSPEDVNSLVKQAEALGWKVVYLAANQDAVAIGRSLGISGQSMSNYSANDPLSQAAAFSTLSMANTAYRAKKSFVLAENVKDNAK